LLVRARVGLDEHDAARTAFAELSNIGTLVATAPLRAAVSLAAGCLAAGSGDADGARTHFEDAVDLFRESGAPFEMARARIELARTLGNLGRTEAAVEEAGRAIDVLSELKAELEISRARRLLDQLPAAPAASAHASPRTAGLTTREVEVLRLVAEGLNNQVIAERLFLSEHTVHRHVANILNKLSVSSRAAAVAQAARHRILD
jgi:ATP/maltotriose-dependent transcriptional regulator MalT